MNVVPSSADALGATATVACQRWRRGRESYRPAGEVFDHRRASVSVIDAATAKLFVRDHHYSGSFPASRLSVGLFRKRSFQAEQLCGVATFSVPMTQSVIPAYFPELQASDGVELGRLVLLDEVEANGETWMLARAFRALREALPQVRGVVAYCDPLPRHNIRGEMVKRGHIGTIYKAHNAAYRGRSRARTLLMLPSGNVANERSLSKVRNEERGAAGVERDLRAQGAPGRFFAESGREWVERLVEEGFLRRVAHPGNHAFTWAFADHRGGRRHGRCS